MTGDARSELLAEVLSRYEASPNPRLREITEAAIRHLHAFAEEVNLQRDEWFAGIEFLTATGQRCDGNQVFQCASNGVEDVARFSCNGSAYFTSACDEV